MEKKALEAFGDLGEDEELGPADWNTVKRYIKSLNSIDGDRIHPHDASDAPDNGGFLDPMNLKDMRVRLLNGTKIFWSPLLVLQDVMNPPICTILAVILVFISKGIFTI